ncbi:hypothetical protein [uncultured Paraglaciecola sp.]|uniref:hypothetical protein n=1 Tax=uncultured Paraglaciecola sp. TaxID=1765024 RepID=UPI00262148C0|nr:hypothetical protein [uncultured Paraglaciecola sp.]
MLVISRQQPPVRNDIAGSGEFLAQRGLRVHYGIDYQLAAGEAVLLARTCAFSKTGQAYSHAPEFRYIEFRDGAWFVRYFYVEPREALMVGDTMIEGEFIGKSQAVGQHYANGMQDHVHVEVFQPGDIGDTIPDEIKHTFDLKKNRTYVDPAAYFRSDLPG